MTLSYRLSNSAKTDIQNIWEYTQARWSTSQAEHYVFGLIDFLSEIEIHLSIAKPIDWIKPGFRYLPYEKHHVYFRVGVEGINEIIRVLHQHMDVSRHLMEKDK